MQFCLMEPTIPTYLINSMLGYFFAFLSSGLACVNHLFLVALALRAASTLQGINGGGVEPPDPIASDGGTNQPIKSFKDVVTSDGFSLPESTTFSIKSEQSEVGFNGRTGGEGPSPLTLLIFQNLSQTLI